MTETEKLESLAKIWGFLKYYHPKVASGKINWDKELLQYLPKLKEAHSKEELSTIYLNWIVSLGKVNTINVEAKKIILTKTSALTGQIMILFLLKS